MRDMGIRGKIALVTGASSGIGKAAAIALAREGAKVALVGRSLPALEEVAAQIRSENGVAEAVPADITKEAEAKKCIEKTVEIFGGLDILVNAAGIIATGSIENTTLEQWDAMFNINTRAVFYLSQLALPYLIERKGNIVNVSSVNGLRAFPNVLAYCVSKAAVEQLTRCAALELAPKGVRVNAVNPGVTITNLHRRSGMSEEQYAQFLERSKTTHPLGRVGRPEEIADVILFLASPHAGWITGASYVVDGGRSQTCLR
jgi:NAD(P)-dependent dehydrogenase (short-subunit alcohol dehydrogenase family)